MTLSLLAPPTRLPHDDEIPLGSEVRWTHRAAVARWKHQARGTGQWILTEGRAKGEWPHMGPGASDDPLDFYTYDASLNKTVVVWPQSGQGFVFGLTRRGIGSSFAQSGGYDSFSGEYDYEPGGFAATAYVPLYAVKAQLSGVGYLLVPHWAIQTLSDIQRVVW